MRGVSGKPRLPQPTVRHSLEAGNGARLSLSLLFYHFPSSFAYAQSVTRGETTNHSHSLPFHTAGALFPSESDKWAPNDSIRWKKWAGEGKLLFLSLASFFPAKGTKLAGTAPSAVLAFLLRELSPPGFHFQTIEREPRVKETNHSNAFVEISRCHEASLLPCLETLPLQKP